MFLTYNMHESFQYQHNYSDHWRFATRLEMGIFIVGRTPSGNLAGVRTIAIWT